MEKSRPLDIGFNLLNFMHLTWPVHEHYFCNETSLSILLNKKIDNFVIVTSTLPEYIDKRFKKFIFKREQDRNKHTFHIIWNELKFTIISIDEYPWLELYKERYVNFNAELLFMDWESQVKDPFKVETELLKKHNLKILCDENLDKYSQQKYERLLK